MSRYVVFDKTCLAQAFFISNIDNLAVFIKQGSGDIVPFAAFIYAPANEPPVAKLLLVVAELRLLLRENFSLSLH